MTRYKLLKSSISLEDFEGLLAFLVAEFEFDKNQAKPCLKLIFVTSTRTTGLKILECIGQESIESLKSDAEIVDENQIISHSGVFLQRTFRFKEGGFSCVERVD